MQSLLIIKWCNSIRIHILLRQVVQLWLEVEEQRLDQQAVVVVLALCWVVLGMLMERREVD